MALELSDQMRYTIGVLRRRINDLDIDDAPLFEDETLYQYIADAVDELELFMFKKNRYVDGGDFRDTLTDQVVHVTQPERMVYAIQAAILVVTAIKIKADRDNFSLRKPTLSVDTSRQSQDHAVTLQILKDDLNVRIVSIMASNLTGYRHSADEL